MTDVAFTHLDEPLFDDAGVTKRALVEYLEAVGDAMVPHLRDRPLSVVRVRAGQPPFMQKNLPAYAPAWIPRVTRWAESSQREVSYALCNDRRTLLWFGNQRAVEYHPELGSAAVVLDLDPPAEAPFDQVVAAARVVREVAAEAGLVGAVKTSGAKGLHVVLPVLDGSVEQVAAAGRAVAERAALAAPDLVTAAFLREDRDGKVFADFTRSGNATLVAAYSPRVRPGVPVSFPLDWDDLDDVDPRELTLLSAPALLAGRDVWGALLPPARRLPDELVVEGAAYPAARVQAMHEGKRRKRRRASDS